MNLFPHIPSYLGTYGSLIQQQLTMALLSVLFGLIAAVPLALLCVRYPKIYPPIVAVLTVVYSLPSIALFVLLVPSTGLTQTTVIIPLTLYSLAALVPNIVEGVRGIPEDVRLAAVAMGYTGARRLVAVDLPLAVPPIMAGLRIATVGNVSMVSVGTVIGVGAFGALFTVAAQLSRSDLAITGVIVIVLLALACDLLLVVTQRLLTPWNKRRPR
ncbi:MAG: ABC transporter permease [Catenulispora sp. 13_1_20CM_3_70_7]|nr:ABC transporter permease [Catenulisporales bacterium]OLE26896.1 MAG: ABC transporter permease [Catenulispora sp. 13_1_20CM_3_70_7]